MMQFKKRNQPPWGPGSNLLDNDQIVFHDRLIDSVVRSADGLLPPTKVRKGKECADYF